MMNTAIEFLKTPYSVDGAHQYIPAAGQTMTASTQENFFRRNYRVHTIKNRVVLDPNDGVVLIQAKYQDLAKANYMMFKNPSYGNKMFYAYIVDIVPRAGNEVVEVYYVMDSVQTYLFEWYNSVKEGYVSREHINPSNPKWVDFTLVEDVPTGKLETAFVHRSIQNNKYSEDSGKKHIRWAVFVSSMNTHDLSGGLYGPPEAPSEQSKPKPEPKPDKPVVHPLPGVSPENSTSKDPNYGFSDRDHFIPDRPKLSVGIPRPDAWDYGMPKEVRDAIIAAGGGGDAGKGNSDLDNSKSLAQTLNYYMVPFRSSLSDARGSITLDGGSVATVKEMSDFFSENQEAVGSLIKVIVKNDIPLDKVRVSGNPQIKITTGGSDNKASIPGGGQYMIFNEANMDLDDDGTVLVQRNNIFDGVHPQKPRLRYPPFTRYYIETEDGAELEFDVTKLPKREAILKYRTNMGPVDNSILHLEGYNSLGGSGRGIDNQYEAHIKFASSKSIPIRTNALASMLQSQENQIQQARTQREGQASIDRSQVASDLTFDIVDAAIDTVGAVTPGVDGLINPGQSAATAMNAASGMVRSSVNSAIKINQIGKSLEWADLEVEARKNDASNRPDTVGNIGADISYNILNKRNDNIIKIKTVSPGYEAIATDYLNRYGYAIMRNKMPNMTHRKAYNYVECALNIRGASIPQKHITKIQAVFSVGVTFWHNASVYEYGQSNGVISSKYHG